MNYKNFSKFRIQLTLAKTVNPAYILLNNMLTLWPF